MRLYFYIVTMSLCGTKFTTFNYLTLVQVWVRPKSEMPI